MIFRTLSIAVLTGGAALAQLESAIITSATAPAAAKAGQTAAKGITSTMGRANDALAAVGGGSSPTAPSRPAVVNPNVSEAKSDFKSDDVKVGMSREELMAVTGKPYSKITIPIDGGSSERLTFQIKDGGSLRIVLELEKVTEINPL